MEMDFIEIYKNWSNKVTINRQKNDKNALLNNM